MRESLASEPAFVTDFCAVQATKHIEHWDWIVANLCDEGLCTLNGMREQRAPRISMSDHSIRPTVRVDDCRFALAVYRANYRY